MFNDTLVAMIEDELERLRRIRAIIVPLLNLTDIPRAARTKIQLQREEAAPAIVEQDRPAPAPPTITRLPPRRPRMRRMRLPKPIEHPTVLKGTIPTAPVVVHRRLAEPVEPKPEPVVVAQPGSFAALVRAAERELELVS